MLGPQLQKLRPNNTAPGHIRTTTQYLGYLVLHHNSNQQETGRSGQSHTNSETSLIETEMTDDQKKDECTEGNQHGNKHRCRTSENENANAGTHPQEISNVLISILNPEDKHT